MPLIPDYQSPENARVERQPPPHPARTWLTVFAFLTSWGILSKAYLVVDGILGDEKPTVVLMLVLASVLDVCSLIANVMKRSAAGIVITVVSFTMLGGAVAIVVHSWR
jgi:hypothetical protein